MVYYDTFASPNASCRMNQTKKHDLPFALLAELGNLFPETCFYVLDNDLKYQYFSDEHAAIMKRVWGVDIELGVHVFDYVANDKIAARLRSAYERASKGEEVNEKDTYPVHEGTGTIERSKYYRQWADKDGKSLGVIVVATEQPIRDKVALEDELIRSEKLMREVNKLAKIGGWELDLRTNEPYFTSGTFDIYDIEDQKVPMLDEGLSFYKPESRQGLMDAITDVITNHGTYDLEVGFVSKKGVEKIVRTLGKVDVEDGEAVRLYGAIQDITEAKAIEQSIRQNQQLFKAIYNGAPLPISMINLKGEILGVNPAFLEIIGYSLEEISDMESWYAKAYQNPEIIKEARTVWSRINEEAIHGQTKFDPLIREIVCKDGTVRSMEMHFSLSSSDFLVVVFIDITEKSKVDLARAKSEELYRNLYNLAPVMIDSLDNQGRILHVNETWLGKLGYQREEVLGKKIFELIHPDDRDSSIKAFNRFVVTQQIDNFRFRFIRKNGRSLVAEVNAFAEFDDNDKFSNTISVYNDVTRQVKAESELLGANQRISNLINNIPGMVFSAMNTNGRELIFASESSKELFNASAEKVVEEQWSMNNLIHEEDRQEVLEVIAKDLKENGSYSVSYRVNPELARNKWLYESATLSGTKDDKHVEGSIFDITDRVMMEERIAAHTMEAEDKERTRISKDIHDGLQQTLSLSALLLDNLSQSTGLSDEDRKLLADGLKHLDRAIDECRTIAHQLMPATITDFGLTHSIENMVADLNSSGQIHVNFISNLASASVLKKTTETSLYRIVQEALTNITKHSKAENCSIQLLKIGDDIQLSIEDDGIGFEPLKEKRQREKLGLRSMENRASAMSGQLMVESKVKGGSLIICRVPYESNRSDL